MNCVHGNPLPNYCTECANDAIFNQDETMKPKKQDNSFYDFRTLYIPSRQEMFEAAFKRNNE